MAEAVTVDEFYIQFPDLANAATCNELRTFANIKGNAVVEEALGLLLLNETSTI